MRGIEKQIEWANNIVNGWVDGLNKMVAEAEDRVKRNTMPPIWATICKNVAEGLILKIKTLDDAAKIIADRNAPVVISASQIAQARYAEEKK